MEECVNAREGELLRKYVTRVFAACWKRAAVANRSVRLFLGAFVWLWSGVIVAGPWLEPGDAIMRHDLQLLSDAGVLTIPMTSWPIAWADVMRNIDSNKIELTSALARAKARVTQRYGEESKIGALRPHLRAAVSIHPRQYRTFEKSPREEGELEAGAEWTGDIFAARLQATYVNAPDDGRALRLDGSYVGALWQNWAVSAGAIDRWWGPGHDGNLILSTNARPIPGVTVQRHLSEPFDNRWLNWLGPWQFAFTLGQLESDRDIPHALFMGMRLNFRPTQSLELGLTRTAQWGGKGRSEDFSSFTDLLLGKDNPGSQGINADNEPGNQLGGVDFRWQSPLFKAPYALYGQFIGEDEAGGLPMKYFGMAGVETWGAWGEHGASWRVHAEYADTAVNGIFGEQPIYGIAYRHHRYTDGYTYRDRVIGHSLGGDGRMTSVGATYVTERGKSWNVLVRSIEPVRSNAASPTLIAAELGHRLRWKNQEWALRLGVAQTERVDSTSHQGQFDVEWQWRY